MLLLAAALYFAVRCAAGGYFNHGNALISAVLTLCVLLYLVPALMKNN
jgi:hypothetical protein